MINLIKPENGAEADALESLLRENNINVEVVSFHDTAYDGLFQAQYGWGVLRVPAADFDRAQKIIREWKKASPGEDVPWNSEG